MSTKLSSFAWASDICVNISSVRRTTTHHTGTAAGVQQSALSLFYINADNNWWQTMCCQVLRPVCQQTCPLEAPRHFVGHVVWDTGFRDPTIGPSWCFNWIFLSICLSPKKKTKIPSKVQKELVSLWSNTSVSFCMGSIIKPSQTAFLSVSALLMTLSTYFFRERDLETCLHSTQFKSFLLKHVHSLPCIPAFSDFEKSKVCTEE